ncbi:MAG: FadR/GntR family transcriptional regulator [Burkholderiales bacterium]
MSDLGLKPRPAAGSGANQTVKAIMAYLQERRLHPGDRLPSERDLAERLGVGRNAVREALATLTTLRVLESRPNSGIYLRRLSTDSSFETLVMLADIGATPSATEILETMEVRSELELLGVRLACERRTAEDLAAMLAVIDQTEAVLAQGGNIIEQDTEFHLALIASAHNGVLVRVLNSFYRFTAARRKALFGNLAQGRSTALDHRKIFDAVQARDATLACSLIEQHMDRARTYWREVLGDAA